MSTDTGRMDTGGIGLIGWYRVVAALVTLLVLIQALLVGRGFFLGKASLVDWHGYLGNLTLLAAIGLAALAIIRGRRGERMATFDLVAGLMLVVLIVVQTGLGYEGTDAEDPSASALAWHIPNGVLIAIISTLLLGRSLPRR